MRVIVQKLIGTDSETGLDRYVQIFKVNIDGEYSIITVYYRVGLLTPTGLMIKEESRDSYTRYDRHATYKDIEVEITPAVYYEVDEDMGGGELSDGSQIKTPAITEFQTVEDKPDKLKYTELEESPIGQGIK